VEVIFDEPERAIAHYLWPPQWVGEQPYWEETGSRRLPDPSIVGDVIATADMPDGIRVRAFRDGMIAFHLGDATPTFNAADPGAGEAFLAWHEKAVRIANAHLACLAATLRYPLLAPSGIASPWSVMQVDFESGKFRAMSDHTCGGTQIALYSAREPPVTGFDWRFYRGRGVTRDHIEKSLGLLRMLLERPDQERALQRAEMLHRASSALVQRDMAWALVNAWTASEGLIGDLLKRYLAKTERRDAGIDASGNRRCFMGTKRKAWLTGSFMTVRHRMEFLSLVDELPYELYLVCRECAKARNDWVHNEIQPSNDVAYRSLAALGRLFELVEGVPLRVLWEDADTAA